MPIYRIQKPFILTIFGASGDLARLKLFPALYSLAEQNRLPENFLIIGFSRTKKNNAAFRKEFEASIIENKGKKVNRTLLKKLSSKAAYFVGNYDNLSDFISFRKHLKDVTKSFGLLSKIPHLAYFSVPPVAFEPIIKNLGESRIDNNEDLRLIIEKPFGEDEKSAQELFHFIARYFREKQIFLLDHYLGKGGVQSILNLRQSNRVLNMLLKGPEIANIQITASENLGITNRVGYFEQVGILKDMFQSHLLQILALISMSIPISESASSLQREKFSILSAVKVHPEKNTMVIGQYASYKKENGVKKGSKTETFAAIRLMIDQEAWYHVPIFIRTGKKLHKKQTYIVIEFKKFQFQNKEEAPNLLVIQISPDEKISLQLVNKYRSGISHYETVTTSESIACAGEYCLPEHGLLLLDVIRNNKMHFLSFPEILASWKVVEQLCKLVEDCGKLHIYPDGSEGPSQQHEITKKYGFQWHNIS